MSVWLSGIPHVPTSYAYHVIMFSAHNSCASSLLTKASSFVRPPALGYRRSMVVTGTIVARVYVTRLPLNWVHSINVHAFKLTVTYSRKTMALLWLTEARNRKSKVSPHQLLPFHNVCNSQGYLIRMKDGSMPKDPRQWNMLLQEEMEITSKTGRMLDDVKKD